MNLTKKQQQDLNEASKRVVGLRIAFDHIIDEIVKSEAELYKAARMIAQSEGAFSVKHFDEHGDAKVISEDE
jgi:hypothetical protein